MKTVAYLIGCLLPSILSAAVFVVDPGGGGDFTTLTAAIACPGMVSGDVIEIKGGTYIINSLGPTSSCSGVTVQNVAGEQVVLEGAEQVDDGTNWLPVGGGVFAGVLTNNDAIEWDSKFPWRVWFETLAGPGIVQELRIIHDADNDECTPTLPSGHFVFNQSTKTLCVHIPGGVDPTALSAMWVPWWPLAFDLSVHNPNDMTFQMNPSDLSAQVGLGREGVQDFFPHIENATCMFTIRRFRDGGFHATTNSIRARYKALCIQQVGERAIDLSGGPLQNAGHIIEHNWIQQAGLAGIRHFNDTSGTTRIQQNVIEQIQSGAFGACGAGGRDCEPGFLPGGAGIVTRMTFGHITRNYIRYVGGIPVTAGGDDLLGGTGLGFGILLEGGAEDVLVAYNYINRGTTYARGDPFLVAGNRSPISRVAAIAIATLANGEIWDGLDIHSNRISDTDRAIQFDTPHIPASGAQISVVFNTIENYFEFGIKWERGAPSRFDALDFTANIIHTFRSEPFVRMAWNVNDGGADFEHNVVFCDDCLAQNSGQMARVGGLILFEPGNCQPLLNCITDNIGGVRQNLYCSPAVVRQGSRPQLFITIADSCAVDIVPSAPATGGIVSDVQGEPRFFGQLADAGADEARYNVVPGSVDPCTGEATESTRSDPILPQRVDIELPPVAIPGPPVGNENDEIDIPVPEPPDPTVVHQCP